MIYIDASVIVAILTEEDESAEFIDAIESNSERVTSPIAIFEATIGVCRKRHASVHEAYEDVVQFLAIAGIQNIAVAPGDARTALDAYSRFGKGHGHPAQLNMADCFAYAMAASRDTALLFKGDDFTKTDARSHH